MFKRWISQPPCRRKRQAKFFHPRCEALWRWMGMILLSSVDVSQEEEWALRFGGCIRVRSKFQSSVKKKRIKRNGVCFSLDSWVVFREKKKREDKTDGVRLVLSAKKTLEWCSVKKERRQNGWNKTTGVRLTRLLNGCSNQLSYESFRCAVHRFNKRCRY